MQIPVYVGANLGLLLRERHSISFHGSDGLGDIYTDKPSRDLIQKKHAVQALHDYIEEVNGSYLCHWSIIYLFCLPQHPNKITLVCVAPLTNVALLYKMYPHVKANIKDIYIMGGNNRGVGNVTSAAEFNFCMDPEAAHIVLTESVCPVHIFPWEVCLQSAAEIPVQEWRFALLSLSNHPLTKLMDPVEKKCITRKIWNPCDAFLTVCFIAPEVIKMMTHYHVTVELAGNHLRGQLVIDHIKKKVPNAFIIEQIDVARFKEIMQEVCRQS